MKLLLKKDLKEAWRTIKKKKLLYFLTVLITFILIASTVSLVTYSSAKIFLNIKDMQELITIVTPYLGEELSDPDSMTPLLQQYRAIMDYYKNIQKYAVFMFLGVFILWILLGSANWFITENMFKKRNYIKYLKKFTSLSLAWYALFVLVTLGLYISVAKTARQNITLLSLSTRLFIYLIIVCALAYFAFISFSILMRHSFVKALKRTGKLGIYHIGKILLMYIMIIAGIAVLFLLSWLLLWIYKPLMYIPLILMFFYLPIARIFLFLGVNWIDRK